MTSFPVFLAIDLGAESCRVIAGILDLDNKKVWLEEIYRFSNIPVKIENSIYWDVLRIWNEIKYGIKLAYKKFGENLISIGIDTWGIDFALLDNNGELIGNPHHYRDPRTNGIMEEILKKIPREEIYYRTGIQFIRINTLYQLYSLVLRKSSSLYSADKFLMIPDLFNYWLSGEKFCEFTEATTTQFYDPTKGDWSFELLEKLNIPTYIFPKIIRPATLLGKISKNLADELNISKKILIVTPACHDTASAVAAAPLNEDSAYISSGTWSLVGVEVKSPIINEKSLAYNYTNEGGAFGTFTFLRNIQGMWFLQECRRIWENQGKTFSYDELTKIATESKPFVAFIDPDDQRFISPSNMIEEIIKYLEETKQNKPKNEGELVRIVLESLALKYRLVLEQAEELTGKRIKQISIIGGGSKNQLLNQLTANFTMTKVIAGPVEATSTGNILLQATALGYIASHKNLREIVKNSFDLKEYEPTYDEVYDELYQSFLQLQKLEK